MNLNKKYGIRKLAVGVVSITIGILSFNLIDDNTSIVNAAENYTRVETGSVDSNGSTNLPKITDEIKAVANGEQNFYSTVALTTEAGLGSGTLISPDTIVTVAHNFVHLNTKKNPITVENNVNKDGDVHIATLPNGQYIKFSNSDIHYWNREGFVQGYKNDLAVIKLKKSFNNQHSDVIDIAKKLIVGDTIHVFGYPKGKLEPILNGKVEHTENYGANIIGIAYQGSKPGASGGGLYDNTGKLIGVNQNGVEGLRSGGITFSKEQLDWIKSIVAGKNEAPVYLNDNTSSDNENHPKYGKLIYTDKNVRGLIGKLYEDGTYVISSDNKENMNLHNTNQGIDSMLYNIITKDNKELSFEEEQEFRNKVKRINVDGKIVADKLDVNASDNIVELDLTGITLSKDTDRAPFLAYYADKLTKLTLDPDLSLNKVKYAYRIIDNAPNLKLTNEQVTQLLKDTHFEESDGIFNNVGIEKLDLSSFDNSKLNTTGVLFKNLQGLKEIVFGEKFQNDKYVPIGNNNSYFETDLSTVEKVSGTNNGVFLKEWIQAVKNSNLPDKEVVYRDGKKIGSIDDVLKNVTDFEKGTYTIGKASKDIDMHYYFVYSIIDPTDNKSDEETRNYRGIILKEEEYFPEKGKWSLNDKLTDVTFPKETDTFEYKGETYKVVGSSQPHIISGPDSTDESRKNYENDSKIWHRGDNLSLFYGDTANAKDGKIVKTILYVTDIKGSYTQLFIDENEASIHKNDPDYNPEMYSIKDKYFSGYHKLTEDFIIPKVPQYIMKNDKIYKLSSKDDEPNIKKYQDSDLVTEYRYKVIHEKSTEEFTEEIQPQNIYEADLEKEKGSENIVIPGKNGSKKTIKKYIVDNNGNLREEILKTEINEAKNNKIKVGSKPKKEYLIKDNTAIQRTTTYIVDKTNGNISEKIDDKIIGALNDETIYEKIPNSKKFIKDNSRDKGESNQEIPGREGSKSITTSYNLDKNTGKLIANKKEAIINEPTDTIIKVAAKDKIEYIKNDNGSTMQKTTIYIVNSDDGSITEKVFEKEISMTGLAAEESRLPELKIDLIKDENGNVLDVIKSEEPPTEIKGFTNTGKIEKDENNYKIYIYKKNTQDLISNKDKNNESIKDLPKIEINPKSGNWIVNGTDTGFRAIVFDGKDGQDGNIDYNKVMIHYITTTGEIAKPTETVDKNKVEDKLKDEDTIVAKEKDNSIIAVIPENNKESDNNRKEKEPLMKYNIISDKGEELTSSVYLPKGKELPNITIPGYKILKTEKLSDTEVRVIYSKENSTSTKVDLNNDITYRLVDENNKPISTVKYQNDKFQPELEGYKFKEKKVISEKEIVLVYQKDNAENNSSNGKIEENKNNDSKELKDNTINSEKGNSNTSKQSNQSENTTSSNNSTAKNAKIKSIIKTDTGEILETLYLDKDSKPEIKGYKYKETKIVDKNTQELIYTAGSQNLRKADVKSGIDDVTSTTIGIFASIIAAISAIVYRKRKE